MKKLFLLAAVAMLMGSTVAFANGGDKNKKKGSKAKTEKTCKKSCCDKAKCKKN